jgi:hypothetical protein
MDVFKGGYKDGKLLDDFAAGKDLRPGRMVGVIGAQLGLFLLQEFKG